MIDATDQTDRCPVSREAVIAAVQAALDYGGKAAASVLVSIVDDPTLHAINRDYLGHDWPTDVCTFPYHNTDGIDGELFVSLDTAAREAAAQNRSTADELTLYVVHGVLHLCGWDDQTDEDRVQMRAAERAVLQTLGIKPHYFQ